MTMQYEVLDIEGATYSKWGAVGGRGIPTRIPLGG